ncbi:unnamed protein product [Fusarium graminearum]|uniref:Chromosome 4, complete genome n=1 Tax=Gibberella zeae (strain ATCC MYA-4620 / CBS 123657 / FGSC 9075 / NRRL 31084 / PH-1) TaxID=229533 RepID=A0A0E0SAH5_GIBZE|nr:hypothetical protein FG05_35385 [Fusarium graminearum]CEF83438.1 unnamed protein product [Fusarium graminearum]CZS72193.1 unnamed protein product [Fusarium graminearum]
MVRCLRLPLKRSDYLYLVLVSSTYDTAYKHHCEPWNTNKIKK